MTSIAAEPRIFQPGTTGWTAGDLDHPQIEQHWFSGRYEIVEGVLATMPAAYFAGSNATANLVIAIKEHLKKQGLAGRVAVELDIVIDQTRVARADAAMLLPADEQSQQQAARAAGRPDARQTRMLVPPTLVIESISPGHEVHDQRTKRKWYAELGVPHYWILNAFEPSLQCLILRDGSYQNDTAGRDNEELQPSLFPGLILSLKQIWES